MTDWLTATAMAASGLILGFMFVYSMRRNGAAKEDVARRDLQAKLDAFVQQLRELDDSADASGAERARLEREAADVLRRLEQQAPAAAGEGGAAAASERPAASPQVSQVKGFLWGVVTVGILVALGYFVTQSSKQRSESEPVTGGATSAPMSAAPTPAAASPQNDVAKLEETVRNHPDDLDARNDLAKAYLETQNLMAVAEQTQYVLNKSPQNARALTYQAIVRMTMGQSASATQMLQAATRSDPSLLDAWVSLAWVDTQLGKAAEAKQAIDEAMRRHPEERERLQAVYERMKTAQEQPAASAPAQQPAAAASEPSALSQPAASEPASGGSIHITLNVDPSAKIPAGGVIFVIARAAGVTAGPPVAVKRLPLSAFPITLDLGASDSMMGQALPDKVRIEARVDSDGNAMTKEPTDLNGVVDGVAVGSAVKVVVR